MKNDCRKLLLSHEYNDETNERKSDNGDDDEDGSVNDDGDENKEYDDYNDDDDEMRQCVVMNGRFKNYTKYYLKKRKLNACLCVVGE